MNNLVDGNNDNNNDYDYDNDNNDDDDDDDNDETEEMYIEDDYLDKTEYLKIRRR